MYKKKEKSNQQKEKKIQKVWGEKILASLETKGEGLMLAITARKSCWSIQGKRACI